MAILNTPGYQIQPSAQQVALPSNYITNFDFLNQYLPDIYEKEFERYGNRTIASFLRAVSAEMPSSSDMIKWAEQRRLHIKYKDCTAVGDVGDGISDITVNDVGVGSIAIREGQTIFVSDNATGLSNKALVLSVDIPNSSITVAYYEAGGQAMAVGATVSIWIYGSPT